MFFEAGSEKGVEAGVRAVDFDSHPVLSVFTTKGAKNTKFLMPRRRGFRDGSRWWFFRP